MLQTAGKTPLAPAHEIAGDPESWSLFFSAPQLVAKEDVHIGYNPIYEYAALPSTEEVVNAIRLTMED